MAENHESNEFSGAWDDEPDEEGESCWHCMGEGGFHDCGEDCCCCLDKDEITETCPECGGTGILR